MGITRLAPCTTGRRRSIARSRTPSRPRGVRPATPSTAAASSPEARIRRARARHALDGTPRIDLPARLAENGPARGGDGDALPQIQEVAAAMWRVGVDSGGTFTDVCLVDDQTGDIRVWKVSSTPD